MRPGGVSDPRVHPKGEVGKCAGQFINAFSIAAAPLDKVEICDINCSKGMNAEEAFGDIARPACFGKRRNDGRIGPAQAHLRAHHGAALQIEHRNDFERLGEHSP